MSYTESKKKKEEQIVQFRYPIQNESKQYCYKMKRAKMLSSLDTDRCYRTSRVFMRRVRKGGGGGGERTIPRGDKSTRREKYGQLTVVSLIFRHRSCSCVRFYSRPFLRQNIQLSSRSIEVDERETVLVYTSRRSSPVRILVKSATLLRGRLYTFCVSFRRCYEQEEKKME